MSLVTHREAQNCYLTSKVFLTINSTSVKVVHVQCSQVVSLHTSFYRRIIQAIETPTLE